MNFLLQHRENSRWRWLTRLARACGRASDAHTVAIHVHHLVRQTYEHDHRPGRRNFGMPNVIAWLELRRERLDRAAFGVVRRSISHRRGEQRGNGDGNESGVFHRCCSFLIHYAASAPSSLLFISFRRKQQCASGSQWWRRRRRVRKNRDRKSQYLADNNTIKVLLPFVALSVKTLKKVGVQSVFAPG